MAKIVKTKHSPITPTNHQNLAEAYDLVINHLFTSLKKIKDGDKIKLGNLGTFHKKERILRSVLHGKTYAYYQVSFKASNLLKKALDE